jgi:DNA-binding SARP family transcriptional activator
VQLFGRFRVWRGGRPINPKEWKGRKHQALFKLLIGERGHFFSHEQLIGLLWPGMDPEKAEALLRRRISELRRILEPRLKRGSRSRYILTCPDGYRFNPEADCLIDVEEFARHKEKGEEYQYQKRWMEAIRKYEAAAQWHHGEYLEEDRYEDWAIPLREKWEGAYLDLLSSLAECYAHIGQYQRAIARCNQLLQLCDHRESVYMQLMLYHYFSGDRAQALCVYERCCRALRERVEISPSPEIQALHRQILQGRIPTPEQQKGWLEAMQHQIPYALGQIPLVGREGEYERLRRHLTAARAGRGRMVLIAGESGIGKTRLAQELLRCARREGALVLEGHCSCTTSGDPYHPLIEAFRGIIPSLTIEDLKGLRRIWSTLAVEVIPELQAHLPGSAQGLPSKISKDPSKRREALIQLLLTLAGSRNYSRPLVLFLDDLHAAAPSLLDWLANLLPRIKSRPILLLGAYRSEEITPEHPINRWKEAAHGDIYEVRLPPLPNDSLERLLLELAPDLEAELRERLIRDSGGNPLYLICLLRHCFEEGLVEIGSQGKWKLRAVIRWLIPPELVGLIERSLERLSHEERRLLRYCAVLGMMFERELLQRAWGGSAQELAKLLSRLIQRGLLVAEEGDRYAFRHEQVREAVVCQLGPERPLIHLQAAEALEALYANSLERHLSRLARHFYQASEWGKALEYAKKAAERSLALYENEEGLQMIELGLRTLESLRLEPKERFELLAHKVMFLDRLGLRDEQEEALKELERFACRLRDYGRRALVLELRTQWARARSDYTLAEAYAKEALRLRRTLGDPQKIGQALNELGRVYWAWGRAEQAERCYQEALNSFRAAGDAQGEAASLNNLGIIKRALGDYRGALECLELALHRRKRSGQRLEAAQTSANIGNVLWALGEIEKALERYRRAYEVFRALGERRAEGKISFNIGLVYSDLGCYGKALEWYERAWRIFTEIADRKGEGEALGDQGLIYAECGLWEEAQAHLERARRVLTSIGDRRSIAKVVSNLGSLHLRRGRPRRAIPFFRQAYRMRYKLGDRRGQGLNLSHLAAAYTELGDGRRAVRYAKRALRHFEVLGVRSLKIEALSRLGVAQLTRGCFKQALEASKEAVRLLEEGSGGLEHPEGIHSAHFRVLEACGHPEAAAYLEHAYGELMRRADLIGDCRLREGFLSMGLNCMIIKLYRDLNSSSS